MNRMIMVGKSNVIMGQLTALVMMYGDNVTIAQVIEDAKAMQDEEVA